jgi:hypothetical protein
MLAIRRIGKGYRCLLVIAAFMGFIASSAAVHADTEAPGALKLNLGTETFGWLVGEDGATEFTDNGYHFSGHDTGTGWSIDWNVMASGSELLTSIVSSLNVVNHSNSEQTYTIYFSDLVPLASQGSLVGGSIGGMVVDLNGDGATLSAVSPTDSIYSGFVDATAFDPFAGNVVGSLLAGQSITAGSFLAESFESESFGDFPAIPGQVGPEIESNVGFGLSFTLSAGDTAGFTAAFAAQIPSPGMFGLLGIAGIFGRRRGRRL